MNAATCSGMVVHSLGGMYSRVSIHTVSERAVRCAWMGWAKDVLERQGPSVVLNSEIEHVHSTRRSCKWFGVGWVNPPCIHPGINAARDDWVIPAALF